MIFFPTQFVYVFRVMLTVIQFEQNSITEG